MKILPIISREYRMIVKKRSFLISTLLTPVLMGGLIFLPMLFTRMAREEKTIHVLDYSQTVAEALVRDSREKAANLKLHAAPVDKTTFETAMQRYRPLILKKEVDGVLLIPRDIFSARKVRYYGRNISDFETNRFLTDAVGAIITRHILDRQQIDPEIIKDATRGIELDTFKVKKEGISRSSSGMDYAMSMMMLTILFSIIMAYGQLIMRGVLEEKNSRIVEILVSSTRAVTVFSGKIIGIGLAGLTQVGLWILLGAVFILQSSVPVSQGIRAFLTPALAGWFALFFVLGYFIFAILFSIVGAAVNTDEEAQQFAAPITWLLVIPFILGILVTQSPDSLPVVIASLIPLFSPTLMFMRISVSMPPLGQVMAAVVSSLVTIWFLAWLGAKIFRTGLLMYGKKPSIREIIRWVRYR
ncbi:MAG: ABC transporter permease [Acidobacteriota bacterium]|jgi:ABC-2 type transport system permease protein|nr:ABC transporter permease [Acidobacteriota bacterium]